MRSLQRENSSVDEALQILKQSGFSADKLEGIKLAMEGKAKKPEEKKENAKPSWWASEISLVTPEGNLGEQALLQEMVDLVPPKFLAFFATEEQKEEHGTWFFTRPFPWRNNTGAGAELVFSELGPEAALKSFRGQTRISIPFSWNKSSNIVSLGLKGVRVPLRLLAPIIKFLKNDPADPLMPADIKEKPEKEKYDNKSALAQAKVIIAKYKGLKRKKVEEPKSDEDNEDNE